MNERAVVLCGFMGSGKTTVGRRVARILGRQFFDSDDVIERRLGRTILELFGDGEEPLFRSTEAAVIAELVAIRPPGVISVGGGALERPETLALVLCDATAVHLDRPLPAILGSLERLRQHRPLLAGRDDREVSDLYAQRAATYQRCPLSIPAARPVDQVARDVVAALATVGIGPAAS